MDTGPVFGQVTTPIKDGETSGELLTRLAPLGADLILKTLDGIEDGSLKPVNQSSEDVSHAAKLLPQDGKINWQNPALAISRQIRGFTPAPGAWTSIDSARIEISPVEITESSDLLPGQTQITKNEVLVGTGSFAVRLSKVKPSGKGWMNAADWARGLREKMTGFDND
jgi:methionyl-tRNA formyltransferase